MLRIACISDASGTIARMQIHRIIRRPVAAALVAACAAALAAQERDRARIPEQYKWNLADIYPNDAAWRAAKDRLAASIHEL